MMRRRRILFVEFVARMEDTRLPNKVRDVRRIGGGRGLHGGPEKRGDVVFPGGGPQSFSA